MDKSIIDDFKFFLGIPMRFNKKWNFILRNCWDNLWKYPTSAKNSSLYLEENDDLIMNLSLPPVENQNSPFKNDLFMLTLVATRIHNLNDIKNFQGKELDNLYFSICKKDENRFEINLIIEENTIILDSEDIFVSAMYKKIDGEYRLIC